jgi:hypothetical protein
MHIHGNQMNVNAANSYSVANGERAAAAERAAAVRKRLLKGAASIDEAASPEETVMIGHWLDQPLNSPGYQADHSGKTSGRDSDLG